MKKLANKLTWISIYFIVIIAFFSCSMYKKTVQKQVNKVNNFEQAYQSVITNIALQQVKIKYKLLTNIDGKQKKLAGNIKYMNDSVLWINVISKTIGIELFRIKCTPDTLFFIDRINKKYYEGNYEFLKNRFGINLDYYFIRSVLFGKVYGLSFSYDMKNINLFKQNRNQKKEFCFEYKLQNIDKKNYEKLKNPQIQNNFVVDKKGCLVNNNYENKNNYTSLQIFDYKYDKQFLPLTFKIHANKKNKLIKLDFIYTESIIDNVNIQYKIPKNYKNIE